MRRLRPILLVGAAGLALPASAGAYGVHVQERLSTGSAGQSPVITLDGTFDYAGTDARTGAISFGLAPELFPQATIDALAVAPAGTQIGTVTSDVTGRTNRLAVRINTSLPTVRAGQPPVLNGAIDVPPLFTQLGAGPLPFTLSWSNVAIGGVPTPQVVLAVSLVAVNQRLSLAGLATLRVSELELTLASSFTSAAAPHALAVVPPTTTRVVSSLTAQPCGDAACTLAAPVTAGVTGTLPKEVTLQAPASARYGVVQPFTGTGFGNDAIQLWLRTADGQYLRTRSPAAEVSGGTYSLRAGLRPIYDSRGRLVQAASGTYSAWDLENPDFVVVADATHATTVRLSAPRIAVKRLVKPHRIVLTITTPGADEHVTLDLRVGPQRFRGTLPHSGVARIILAAPKVPIVVRAAVSVAGAGPASASRRVAP